MEGSPPERDVLLVTKLQVPRSRPGLVPRRRLADRLEEGLDTARRVGPGSPSRATAAASATAA
jgi:hypothetical protein